MATNKEPKYCYLIISPDPSEYNQLRIEGKTYAQSKSSKEHPKKGIPVSTEDKPLHFIKFGDHGPKEVRKRVRAYRTHNPSFWWRTIELTDGDKLQGNLGKYLEKFCLKGTQLPYERAEWHALPDQSEELEDLCQQLDDDLRVKGGKWWINKFDNKVELDNFFQWVRKMLTAAQKPGADEEDKSDEISGEDELEEEVDLGTQSDSLPEDDPDIKPKRDKKKKEWEEARKARREANDWPKKHMKLT